MRVRMTTQIHGTRDGVTWPKPGSYAELPEAEARDLIRAGDAVAVDHEDERGWLPTERGVVPPSELREGDGGIAVSSQYDLDVWPPNPAVQSGPNALQALPGMPQTVPSTTLTAEGTTPKAADSFTPVTASATKDMAAEAETSRPAPVTSGADVDHNVVEGTNDAGDIPARRTRKG